MVAVSQSRHVPQCEAVGPSPGKCRFGLRYPRFRLVALLSGAVHLEVMGGHVQPTVQGNKQSPGKEEAGEEKRPKQTSKNAKNEQIEKFDNLCVRIET